MATLAAGAVVIPLPLRPEPEYAAPARILLSAQPPVSSSALRAAALAEPEFAYLYLGTAAAMDAMTSAAVLPPAG